MPAMLLRPWFERLLVAGALAAIVPASALAGWPWSRPAPQPAIPVGPPIYAPSAVPTVTNYQPSYTVPSNQVPAAVAPSLVGPPTTYTPPPVGGYAPAPTMVAPAPIAGSCAPCGNAPRVTGYVPPTYGTNWAQVPTTTYRPVVSVDPATGLPINAVQPCTTNIWQARRVPNTWWGGLWPATTTPPTVVAYTPATIAAYPQARITNYAPPVTQVIAPRPVVTQYAPVPTVTQYGPAPVVTQYAPAPTVTQYAPAPTVTQFAPAPAPTSAPLTYAPAAPVTQSCPHGCPNGQCQQSTYGAATTSNPQGSAPANMAPSLSTPGLTTPQSSYPGTTIVPNTGNGREPASIAPRLDSGATIRQYAPTEYDNQPVVPVAPPVTAPVEGRVIETPRIQTPQLQSPQLQSPGTNSSSMAPPKTSPFIPFARPVEKPASTPVPERNLRLVPDPDAEKLELRRDDIPNLIKPGDRMTHVDPPRSNVSVPIAWPSKPTVTMKPKLDQPTVIPAALPARPLDDSGWRSVAQ